MLYFAYASNLNKEYMLSRCPNAIPLKKVMLRNYKLTFNQLGDIMESVDDFVYGALYLIAKQDLHELDSLEGYPTLYDRIIIEVEDDNGNKYDALAYIMPEKDEEAPPDHYLQLLIKGYEDWMIPQEFLNNSIIK